VVVRLGEAQAVENRDGARAHGDDVAKDPTDARRRPLERLHRRRMVVRLDLEGDRLAVADVDDAGVLAGSLKHSFSAGRKPFEQKCRVLVAAVFRPEEREDGQLEVVRVASEQPTNASELLVGQPQRAVQRRFRRDLRQEKECSVGA
jgi:hypothetical protein